MDAERLHDFLEALALPAYVYCAETFEILAINVLATETFAFPREAFLRATVVDIVPRAVRHIVAEAVAALPRSTPMMAVEYSKRDGTTFWANAAGRAIRVGGRPARLVLVTDITEHRRTAEVLLRTEDQVRQAQKMEALGRLAGGVAHDFNNLLSVILGYSDMLLKDVGAESPMRDDLDEVRKAAQRGADLCRQLLLFSRHRRWSRRSSTRTSSSATWRACCAASSGHRSRSMSSRRARSGG